MAAALITFLLLKWQRNRRELSRSSVDFFFAKNGSIARAPLEYKTGFANETIELSSDQRSALMYGQPKYTIELGGAAVQKIAYEKGSRDSYCAGRHPHAK